MARRIPHHYRVSAQRAASRRRERRQREFAEAAFWSLVLGFAAIVAIGVTMASAAGL